jgi:type I restriction enzyme R subunit
MFKTISQNATPNEWQKLLKDEQIRKDFYNRLKNYAGLLNLALTNREIFKEVGIDLIEKYRADYLFFKKLKDSVIIRYDDPLDYSRYEEGIQNLINTFVNAEDIKRS